MFKKLKGYRGTKKAQRIQVAKNRGYDYAMGCIMRGEKTPRQLDDESCSSYIMHEDGCARAFDQGIRDAIDKAVSVGAVEDDRL